MDRLNWISYLLVLLFCIGATSIVYGDELSDEDELMNDGTVKVQGDAAFPSAGDPASTKADITFLVHVNKGAKKSAMEDLVNFLKYLLTYADIDSGAIRVALAYYKLNVKVDFDFNQYTTKTEVYNALDQFKESKARSPKANVAGALKSLPRLLLNAKKGDRAGAQNYVILITDLEANAKKNLIQANAQFLKNTGAKIITIGVGFPNSNELRTIASDPPGLHSFAADDYAGLAPLTQNVLRMIPPLDVPPPPPATSTVPPPPRPVDPRVYTRCDSEADLVFILDTSARVTEADFKKLLQFSKQLLDHVDIDSGNVKIGFLTSSAKVKIQFHLRRYQNKVEILQAIDRIPYVSGSTNTAEALKQPRMMFVPRKGERPDVTNVAVLLTDARSSLNSKKTLIQAKRARDKFYKIIAVGIGFPDEEELNQISSDGLSFSTQGFGTLMTLLTPVAQAICSAAAPEAPRPTQPDPVGVPTNSAEVETPEPATLAPTAPPPPPPTTARAPPPPPPTTTAEPILEPVVTSAEPPVPEIEEETTEKVTPVPATEAPVPRRPETPPTDITKTIFTFPEIEECRDVKLDIVFVLDTSTSVTEPNFIKILAFLKSFLNEAPIHAEGVRVGVLTYSTDVRIQFHLNAFETKAEIFEAIDKIPYHYGSTNTAEAIRSMHNDMFHGRHGDREDAANVAFIVTDGVSNVNSFKTIDEAEKAKNDRIHIYAIGIGLADTRELNKIASAPISQNRFIVREFDELDRLQSKLFEKICPVTTLPPVPVGGCESATADVVFMVDTSTSVGEPNFKKTLNFIKHFLHEADIDRGAVRVGVAIYSTSVYVKFNLNEYATKDALFLALDDIQYRYGSTNIAHALRVMRTRMFRAENGDRPEVKNIGIIITDGISNYEHYETVPQAILAQDAGIHVYAIGIGLASTRELEKVATPPAEENMFVVRNFDELDVLSYRLFEPYCPAPIRTERPTEPTVVETTTEEPELIVTTPEPEPTVVLTTTEPVPIVETTILTEPEPVETTTTAPEIIAECHAAMADIVFLVDTSTSVSETNFKKIINFIKHFLSEADIDRGAIRVGVAIYSTSVYVQFDLNDYSTKEEVFAALDKIRYRYGSTNIAHAFRVMRTRMFTIGKGDRPEIENIGIIITDGVSNIEHYETVPQARLSQGAGIHIYAIGVGLAETSELERIASAPAEENAFIVQNFDELDVLMYKVFEQFCPVPPTLPPTEPPTEPPTGECSAAPSDIVFVIDSSTSVGENNFKKVLSFIKNFLSEATIGPEFVQVGILLYSTDVNIQFHLNDFKEKGDVFAAIDRIKYRYGSTNTAGGIEAMRQNMFTRENGDRINAKNIAFIVTDGVSNINAYKTMDEAKKARAEDIHIYAIGIGLDETTELRTLASEPAAENTFTVEDFDGLESLKKEVFDTFCPSTEPPTPPPTTPVPTTACRSSLADVVLVLDSSTSVSAQNFQKMLTFAKNFLSDAGIDAGGVRVGLLVYSTKVHIQFHLNEYSSKSEVFAAIDRIQYRYGDTNTAAALKALRTEMFTTERGDRMEAPNVALVLTDGVSNIDSKRTVIEAMRAQSEDIHIYAIGIGLADPTELEKIASAPAADNSFNVEDFDELDKMREEVFAHFCPEPTKPPPEPECTVASSDVVFLLDSSTSVLETNFRKVLAFVKEFLSEAYFGPAGIRVGLVTYSTRVNVQFYLNSYETKEEIFNAIDKVPYTYGSTNTAGGLEKLRLEMFTREHGDRPESGNVAIIVTDGVSNVNPYRTLDEAALLKSGDVKVYGVGIGLVELTELRQIVSKPPEENTFLAQNFDDLQGLKRLVFAEMCPVPPTTTPIPTTTEKCRAATSDIAFLLDSSTSVSEANFKKVLSFVKEFLSTAHIAADGVRVSVVTYSTSVHVEFLLDRYTTKEEIFGAIDRIAYRYGSTNTAEGLKAIRQQVFSVETGDRGDAPNFLFVVTDGVSNLNAYRTIEEAELAKNQDIHIYAIGIGLADTNELKKIASEPTGANTFIVQEFSELKGVQAELFEEFCPEACTAATSDIVFLLDSSTSVSERNFKKVLEFVKEFLTEAYIAPEGIRVGVITFSSYAYSQFDLNKFSSKEEVFEAVDSIPYSYGSTNTAAGLRALRAAFAKGKGDRPGAPNYALVVTDGVSNINTFQTLAEAELTRNQDIHIYAIGVGLSDTSELEKIASKPSRENTFNVQDFNELQGIKKDLFQQFCPDMHPRIITTPAPPPTTTRPIFNLKGKCSAATGDVIFVLDSSTSVSERNFKKMLNFVKDFLSDATISTDFVRVGVLVYSTSVYIQFHLNEYKTKEEVFAAIDRIQYTYGSTNTAGALKVMRNTMFSKQNGDRDGVRNLAIVVTDGVSNINSHQTIMEAEKARAADIHIYAIGVGLSETGELEQIASAPAEENKFAVQDFEELLGLKAKVFKEFCPETCISTSMDIVFLLDTSTSVEERNFKKMITFIKDLLSNSTIDSGIVRVGVATYSTSVHVEFNLNDYSTKADVFRALDRVRYRYGNTNTAGALHTMRTRMFAASRGDRENSIDVAILITDGVSNINTNRISIEAQAARDRGIQVYAIGIALAETNELIKIASEPAEDYTLTVEDFRELQGLKGKLFDFCDLGR